MNNKKENNINSLEKKNPWPATLYVEGQDQFRGWFNSSLITSVIFTGKAPYQQVVTHGFVVDERGKKMSKSLGNIIEPSEVIEKFGVDVIRLWVASADFTKEVKISVPLLQEIQGNYQKIRNTCRFLLANLATLTSEKQLVEELEPVDEWVLNKLNKLVDYSQENYQKYNFNLIYQTLLHFCVNDLSSFYFEISKDSLYCDNLESPRRKQIIIVLYYLLIGLLKIITPLLPFLAEEIYENIPFKFGYAQEKSVMFLPDSRFPLPSGEQNLKLIEDFLLLRQEVFSALEKARQTKIIHTNSQARVFVVPKKESKTSQFSSLNLARLLLIAQIEFTEKTSQTDFYEEQNYWIKVVKTSAARCVRCWNYEELKEEICSRCWKVLN
ncbi:class I tRNA ligase family protein [endosymbiont GvMRE of Glomus versiforme]|uniref:class I tRNA ligase family protein n=1 Tax=endosymbiont GvMRE of Glomus versiforme TaxID=2039283 RepID=UPI000EEC38C1|nr:class I tRNA ligase family protein [endosymbiont GvMRE of Glomus versiforme]RHZ37673.1 Isoleucine--tRNA ligase [endosymbiont GvMRE of Glomus versiforme]